MVAWMAYLTGVAAVLGVAGLLAERGLRRLGLPARWVWACSLVATVAVPLAFAAGGRAGDFAVTDGWHGAWGGVWGAVPAGLGTAGLETAILVGWTMVSLMLLASVRLAGWTLRRNERSWRAEWADGHRVLVSERFGPGVIGASRPRAVIPRWLLEADDPVRRMVVLHEAEHARAGDVRLLMVGMAAVLLVPWCVPVWWQLRRLRSAIEMDCDQRVVARGVPTRDYARALVAVAGGRGGGGILPVPALAPARGELERRIRMLGARPRGRSGRAGLALLAAAGALVMGLGMVPAPDVPGLGFEAGAGVAEEAARSATLLLSVTQAADR